jgi:hypothetical protein
MIIIINDIPVTVGIVTQAQKDSALASTMNDILENGIIGSIRVPVGVDLPRNQSVWGVGKIEF